MELLSVKNLDFTYGGQAENVLSGVSMHLREGEFAVLYGPSGCGKTTLLRLLKREIAPFGELSGEIRYRGCIQTELPPRESAGEIGYVMQNPENQVITDKVWHELAFGAESLGLPGEVIHRRVAETAAYFGIDEWFQKDTAVLSGGQKQILNLAAVMVCNPRLLLLDEPTAMLDPIAATTFLQLLHRLNRELGVTVLIAEHRLEEVLPMADRVLVMDKGNIVMDIPPVDLTKALSKGDAHGALLKAMPASVQIHQLLSGEGLSPLTVREGKAYLQKHFTGITGTIEVPERKMSGEAPVLEAKEVYFRYERESPDILQGATTRVFPGDFLCIVGGNGVGKTTLLQVLSGIRKPYRGKVTVGAGVSMLPQNPRLVFLSSVLKTDYQDMLGALGVPASEWENRIEAVAGQLGIRHLLERHPYDLSGGEQQKAALGKILLGNPRVLLLDEPTKGMDAQARDVLSGILRGLCKTGTAVITVTHDLDFCGENATGCALLSDGRLIGEGEPHGFFSGNRFYTTAAARIGGDFCENGITCQEVASFLLERTGKDRVQ